MALSFITYLEYIAPLSEGLKKAMESHFEVVQIPKGTVLLREEEVCQTAYFIVSGTARLYYRNGDREITSRFLERGTIAISYYSYFSQRPSFETLHLLEDCTMEMVRRDDFEGLYVRFPELHNIMRLVLEKAYIITEERALILRSLPAKDRFRIMQEKFPRVFQIASTDQIASFLGLTRETLSRMRSEYARKRQKEG